MDRSLRVLLIAYYWPPSGGAGVQRWVKMVKYLCRMGYEVTVYTPSNPDFPVRDESLLGEIPEEAQILHRRIVEPYAWFRWGRRTGTGLMQEGGGRKVRTPLQRIMLWIRANVFVPDARMLWVKPSVRYLSKWLADHPQDALVTTGPPHSVHLIGLQLARTSGVRWVADFRDPWVGMDYMHHLPLSGWARRKHVRMEQSVIAAADEVVVVTPSMRKEYEALVGREVHLVMNGFDDDDFASVSSYKEDGPFILLYAGSLNADRNPHALWQAMQLLAQRGILKPGDMLVRLMGAVDGRVRNEVQSLGIDEYVDYASPIPHTEVPQMLCSASALLLCVNDTPNSKGILTGKLFEYLASGRPIICTGPKDGDAAQLLAESGAGNTFDRDDTEALATYLLALQTMNRKGQLPSRKGAIEAYSRRSQAMQMGRIIEGLAVG